MVIETVICTLLFIREPQTTGSRAGIALSPTKYASLFERIVVE
jgi:hypothetical protein